jgi:dienelactone hydrolase
VSLLDHALLAALAAVSAWWVFAPQRKRQWLRLAPIALAALAALQLVIEGFYWQFLLAYLLILILALLSVSSRGAPSGLAKPIGRLALIGLVLAAIAPFALMLPVPALTRPDGPHIVGTEIFRWVDAARDEPRTPDPADRRNVIAQIWYPAASGAKAAHSAYIDGLENLPDRISLFPGFILRSYGAIDTHGLAGAGISPDQTWPVVILSSGYGGPRAVYTSLATGLASRGYAVITLDHPYESAVTQLADGRIVAEANTFPASGTAAKQGAFMVSQLDTRVADIRFVLDQLEAGAVGELSTHLDLQHIAAIGHSFGGAASAVAMDRDPRIKAAANIDGTLYGDISEKHLTRPFLLLDSDHVETGHSAENIASNQRLLANAQGPAWRYEIKRANHYSFTDAPLFFAPPGRFALALLIGGGRGPEETHRITIDILDAFLSGGDVEAAAAKYKDIAGERVN